MSDSKIVICHRWEMDWSSLVPGENAPYRLFDDAEAISPCLLEVLKGGWVAYNDWESPHRDTQALANLYTGIQFVLRCERTTSATYN